MHGRTGLDRVLPPDLVPIRRVHRLERQRPHGLTPMQTEPREQIAVIEVGERGVRGRIDSDHAGCVRNPSAECEDEAREPALARRQCAHASLGACERLAEALPVDDWHLRVRLTQKLLDLD